MSFKEIKSLLRMVNVDMNDMYAYRLFKVGAHHYSHLCLQPSPSHRSHQLLSPALMDKVASPSRKSLSRPTYSSVVP